MELGNGPSSKQFQLKIERLPSMVEVSLNSGFFVIVYRKCERGNLPSSMCTTEEKWTVLRAVSR